MPAHRRDDTTGETTQHPLLAVLISAAQGRFPPVDGMVEFVPPLPGGLDGVVSFTGHAYVATARPASDFGHLALDGYGAALSPSVLSHLAGPSGSVGVIDVTLVARGTSGPTSLRPLVAEDHPRVEHARRLREDVRVYGDERGLVTLAKGLAGRTELSIEVPEALRDTGVGRHLLAQARCLAGRGTWVFAAVSPGNARSLRALLAAGFAPIGSEVLIARESAKDLPPSRR